VYNLNIDEYDILLDLLGYKNPKVDVSYETFIRLNDKINSLVSEIDLSSVEGSFELILWNDNVNVLDNVRFAINDICGIENTEAYKITTDAHLKGRSVIKKGKLDELMRLHKRMSAIGIITTIK